MELLKKIFPLSFGLADTVANLVIGIIIYVVAGAVLSIALGFLALIPLLGIIFNIVLALVDIYVLAGIVIEILVFTKVLK